MGKSAYQREHTDSQNSSLTTDKKIRLFGFELNKQIGFGEQEESQYSSIVSSSDVIKKFKCKYCFKGFGNSHALGGHQKAHKRERVKKKKLLLEATEAAINYYLHPYEDHIIDSHEININFQGSYYAAGKFSKLDSTTFDMYDKDLVSFKDTYNSGRKHGSGSKTMLSDDSKQNYIDLNLQLALGSYSTM